MPAQPAPTAAPVVPGLVLEELLGRGGSGQVWRARPRSGGPPVAVKVLVRGDPERQEREATLLGELDHPHLVRLHEVVRREVRGAPAQVALVLDLLEGGSLAALLARRGRLRPGEVVTTVAPVAAALAHAHDRGVVHGDLSPGNIVFTAEGRPVLTDLGTARLVGDAARAEVTPPYVDPVVARGGAPGPASDVFGVAAAAFHALTGIAPWNAADPAGTLTVAAGGQLPDLAVLAPEAPEELVRVVLRGLSPEPHERGSAAAFALDLRHACRPEPVRLPVAGVPDTELAVTGRGPRTELTHQVPGQRPRAAHAAPAPASRLARARRWSTERSGVDGQWRALVRRSVTGAAVVLAVGGALAGAVWLGSSWGSAGEPVPAAVAGPAPTGDVRSTAPSGSPTGPPASPTGGATAPHGPAAPAGGRPGDRAPQGDTAGTAGGATAGTPERGAPGGPGDALPGGSGAATPRGPGSAVSAGPGTGTPGGRGTGTPGGPGAPGTQPAPAPTGSATASSPAVAPQLPSPSPPTQASASPPAADRTETPVDEDGWAGVVGELYQRRTAAFAAGADPAVLATVHAPGSPLLARDTEQLTALRTAGRVVEGFTPQLREVVSVREESPGRVRVLLVDALPAYRTGVPAPGTRELQADADLVPGRGDARVELVLARTPGGWRIAEGGLVGGG
ncbi:protein kinase [Modestobacter sp. VKM Ac-2986]|uniref:serine/threonine-protein kinase n=1 Tax=Modestobacter sp. VKM Ac-2986 TaxID=3004140 RepID=UPI0022AAE38B|nr:serine/threonine-protein kinase [Modestobacter sp. VKM Ac-2986]MCZ2828387.1 protein kinase [Modestobacter sp. VKM Ac-2986]